MDEISTAKKELIVINQRIGDAQKEFDQILQAINGVKEERDTIQSDIFRLQNIAKLENDRVEEYKKRREGYEKDLDEKNESKKVLVTAVSQLEEEAKVKLFSLEQAKKLHAEEVNKVKSEQDSLVNDARRKLSDLEVDMEEAKVSLANTLAQIKTKNEDIVVLTNQITTLDNSIDKLSKQESGLVQQVMAMTEDIETMKNNVKKAQKDEEEAKALINELNITTDDLKAIKEALETEIEELKGQKATSEAEYTASQNKIFALVEREEQLNQREAFIKEKYEKAGITYR